MRIKYLKFIKLGETCPTSTFRTHFLLTQLLLPGWLFWVFFKLQILGAIWSRNVPFLGKLTPELLVDIVLTDSCDLLKTVAISLFPAQKVQIQQLPLILPLNNFTGSHIGRQCHVYTFSASEGHAKTLSSF